LIFTFDGSSWVEVRDAAGRTLFSQMNAKGTTQVVEGRPPFHLVVGNASHVRLQYNDQPIDLRPHTRVDVARLSLE
jgi:cytoskeleton protein RodZ